MSESEVHGAARLEVLRKQMRSGEVDTLIVAFTDMQGRLMGKRASAAAFLDGAASTTARTSARTCSARTWR